MKKIQFTLLLSILCFSAFSQQNFLFFNSNISKTKNINKEPIRILDDQGLKGIELSYHFPGADVFIKQNKGINYQVLKIKNFPMLEEVGKPALPCHTDIIAIPLNASAKVKIISFESKKIKNYLIYPALKLALDKVGAPNPEFEIDNLFYSQDITYPENIVDIVDIQKIRGTSMAIVKICPIQYNPKLKEITVYSNIRYKIEFTESNSFINPKEHSNHFLNLFPNIMLNNKEISKEISSYKPIKSSSQKGTSKNYIIITQNNYLEAADSLAKWKKQMGYSVEIISKQFWNSALVKSEIQTRYSAWNPKPDFVVFLGDHQDVPGQIIINSMGDSFATDLYYTCMDGANDYYADMARGRISVNSPSQALMVVQKIINYERFPFSDSIFYKTGINAAYFQDDDLNGYADRRFAQTSEDIRNYMVSNQNFDVTRVYKTATATNPMYWNNGTYANGEAIPTYLKKPGFPWNGNSTNINNKINSSNSALYLFHRDHGYELGWGDPSYTNTDLNNLTNGNRLPVVFSINCLTGKFLENECFSEKFLRIPNGGTAGIFGHAEVSYSGYNDGLSLGLIDAIWSSPGLIPNFTGNGDNPQGSPTAHTPIYTLGDVCNQGLIRMVQTWGNNQYTFELLHYFGDPSMKIWTANPTQITANHTTTINCTSDTTISITNASCLDAIATLVADDELIGSVQLINGSGIIHFSNIYGTVAKLTISKHNYKPYITDIIVNGGCPNAKFALLSGKSCIMDSILVANQSSGNIASYNWNFGLDAFPLTSNLPQPNGIIYSTSGNKTITLSITDLNNNVLNFSKNIVIEPLCKYYMPKIAQDSSNSCEGILYDDGGEGDYNMNSNGLFVIKVPGAMNITLNFTAFDFDAADAIIIYDGDNTLSPSLGTFTGNNLPLGGIINSTSNALCIKQITNSTISKSGFEVKWHCNMPAAPIANFKVLDSTSCSGAIEFKDLSTNSPNNWHWDFGDGNTSSLQNPTYIYQSNGTYNVKLIISNAYGQDTIIKTGIVSINKPNIPVISGNTANCGASTFTFNASGQGTINWYNTPNATIPFSTANNLTTALLSNSTTYYVESQSYGSSKYGAKPDNTGGGSYFNNTNIHYLMFNCTSPAILKSVKVYAASAGNRTVNLRNSAGNIIATKTMMIPMGESRVNLDFNIPVGNNFQLEGSANPNLYRNNAGCSFPYQIGNSISITKSSATQSPTSYYYFYYDWEISDEICKSNRLPLEIFVNNSKPTPAFNFSENNLQINFNNQTIDGNTYLWDFGDGNTSTLINPSHIYTNYGSYNVKLISYNACGNDSITIPLSINLGLNENDIDKITISPNPTNNIINIYSPNNEEINKIQLFNTSGQLIYSDLLLKSNSISINLSKFAKGIYYLHIQNKENINIKKIVKL